MKLILCQGKIAENPYFFKDADVNVYSYEELCYVIVNYPEEVSGQLASEDLFNWIKTELTLTELADNLISLSKGQHPISKFAVSILSYGGYSANEDVNNALVTIRKLENIPPKERDKIRADKMLEEGRCFAAISLYKRVIEQCEFEERALLGKLWHNMGVCYARMFIFDTAGACFERAFHFSGSSESRKEALLCSFLMYGDREYDTDINDIDLRTWYDFADLKKENANSEAVSDKIAEITRNMRAVKSGDEKSFFDIYEKVLQEFKDDYLKRAEYGAV
ncbi:MAG: hypothetical protein K6G40_01330 [Eubacterium sp.]|nr:hypothetical protein [Eubacterium sp.]